MEPDGSLPLLQEPTTNPYSQPDESSQQPDFTPTLWALCFSFIFFHWNFLRICHHFHLNYMTWHSHTSRFDHWNNIWWKVPIVKLVITMFIQPPFSLNLRFKYSPQLVLKNFPTFCGTRWFIAMFTKAHHYSLSSARRIQPATWLCPNFTSPVIFVYFLPLRISTHLSSLPFVLHDLTLSYF
jgi:hypothetical protein